MASLRLVDVRKSFGSVAAVRGVDLELRPGEIHAVVGENGAGKSTLLRIGAGLLAPDGGHVEVDGRPLAPHTPREAIARGVAMVEQHFALIDVFDALDNVQLGVEPVGPLGVLRRDEVRAKVARIEEELGAPLRHGVPVAELAVGERQRIEIVRALYREAKVLILDEPTAVLSPGEAEALYALLRRLAEAGRAIAVVTHRLGEVQAHAQRVSILRRGALVESRTLGQQGAERELAELTAAIMGDTKDAPPHEARRGAASSPTAAEGAAAVVEGVTWGDALRGVSFRVGRGEIVGIAGIEGNGQKELVDVLSGFTRPDRGTLTRGTVAVVYGDRHKEGLVLDASVAENLMLGELSRVSRGGLVDGAAYDAEVQKRHARAGIVPEDASLPARALSGGNQQKIVMARAVAAVLEGATLVVLSHPTRGVDLRASRAIYDEIFAFRDRGCGVVVVSADLAELHTLADRILVLTHGRIVAEFAPNTPDDVIGRAMLGLDHDRAPAEVAS